MRSIILLLEMGFINRKATKYAIYQLFTNHFF